MKITLHTVLFVGINWSTSGEFMKMKLRGPIYTLKYSTGEKMQKKIEEEEAIKEAEESWYLWEE